jgi:AcrR family transcriptional regulator
VEVSDARIEDFAHGRVPRVVRQRQIVELAEELFSERGYQGASMDELARRAGVTKPVVYELFGNKDGLFRSCLERSAERLATEVAEAVRAESQPEARVRAGGLAFLRFAKDNRVAWELMMEGRSSDAANEARRRQAALVHELLLEKAPADVDPRELELAAHAVNSAYEGVAHWMWEHPDVPLERLADWTARLLLPGLRRFT